MTEASIHEIKVPRFVHIKVDGFANPRIADPSTKNGKADVKRDNIESSFLPRDDESSDNNDEAWSPALEYKTFRKENGEGFTVPSWYGKWTISKRC